MKRLPADAQLNAQFANLAAGLAYGGLSKAEFSGGHLERPPAVVEMGGGQAGAGAFELGECCEDAEHQPIQSCIMMVHH